MKKRMVALMMASLMALGICMINPLEASAAEWKKDNKGWWLQEESGYPVNQWRQVNGKWYYFDQQGYMVTGWRFINDEWYYMYPSGEMASSTWVGDYYLEANGEMADNTWIGEYYVGSDGRWIPNYGKNLWMLDNTGWWYRHADGSYTTNDWEFIDGKWYYFDHRGYMVTGWLDLHGDWYYLDSSGAMVTNTWVGNCYIGSDGQWIPDKHPEDTSETAEKGVFRIVNEERVKAGLSKLQYDTTLASAAKLRAKELEQLFDHVRPNGTLCFTVLDEFGIQYYSCGENIAAGYVSPEKVMIGWMNSPGHYKNIMGDYANIGVGHYVGSDGTQYWVQLFTK